jgi:hypothetical protein
LHTVDFRRATMRAVLGPLRKEIRAVPLSHAGGDFRPNPPRVCGDASARPSVGLDRTYEA